MIESLLDNIFQVYMQLPVVHWEYNHSVDKMILSSTINPPVPASNVIVLLFWDASSSKSETMVSMYTDNVLA